MSSFLNIFAKADRFTVGIVISVILGLLLPCEGSVATGFDWLTNAAIVLLFYLYGVKLSRESVIAGLLNWRLQLMVFGFTFIFFPLVMPLLRPLFEPLVGASLFMGLIYVACLPSTVQSSIAFTAVAGGNVPAAVCSASVSSLLGVFLTPLLVGLLFTHTQQGSSEVGLDTFLKISFQILLPFILGQFSQRRLQQWVNEHKALIKWNDQGTIWLVIYTSFSGATANGYWNMLESKYLLGLILVCAVFLCLTFAATWYSSRWMGFNRQDRITIVFCGSKKSLAVGAPMMMAIFGELDNNLLLPLMVFHQVQLMACAQLARLWQKQSEQES
ncbi:MAG: bile acid:sodium symporter family protein [Akkermansia sp.]|nr:bile acid:sodium symporter family protein [Akkermansia sp.]